MTHLVPQPEVNFRTSGGIESADDVGIRIHTMPRSDEIALGGTVEDRVWALEPNEAARPRIVNDHIELHSVMHPPDPRAQFARSTAPVRVPSLKRFCDLRS